MKSLNPHTDPLKPDKVPNQRKGLHQQRNPLKPEKFPNQQKGLNQGWVSTNRGILANQTKFPTNIGDSI